MWPASLEWTQRAYAWFPPIPSARNLNLSIVLERDKTGNYSKYKTVMHHRAALFSVTLHSSLRGGNDLKAMTSICTPKYWGSLQNNIYRQNTSTQTSAQAKLQIYFACRAHVLDNYVHLYTDINSVWVFQGKSVARCINIFFIILELCRIQFSFYYRGSAMWSNSIKFTLKIFKTGSSVPYACQPMCKECVSRFDLYWKNEYCAGMVCPIFTKWIQNNRK